MTPPGYGHQVKILLRVLQTTFFLQLMPLFSFSESLCGVYLFYKRYKKLIRMQSYVEHETVVKILILTRDESYMVHETSTCG